ncbi:MAG: carboxypeptidase-like regulatory domain-containing protein [Pirellulales bacterium]
MKISARIRLRIRLAALTLACLAMLLPQTPVKAADDPGIAGSQAAVGAMAVQDVTLAPGGVLQGQVLDSEGFPVPQTDVSVWSSGQQVASTRTDVDGNFVVTDLRGGNYAVVAGEGGGLYRLWTENSAPPHASQRVLIVSGRDAQRGQSGFRFRRPWRPTTIAILGFAGGIVAGGLIGQANSSGS